MGNSIHPKTCILLLIPVLLVACGTSGNFASYHDPDVDFANLRTIAVMPFANLTSDKMAGPRVRDTFMTSLLATGVVYVIPAGEVARGIARAGLARSTDPSGEDVAKLAAIIKVDAVITGVVREYGLIRSGSATAGVVSVSMQMIERQSRKVVWSAATTKGGVSTWDRLFGGGGRPMNEVTEAAVNDIINKLFY
jgi:hypothetical protein